jgi:hypothetical protein
MVTFKAEMLGSTTRLNPFSKIIDVIVRIDRSIIKIPVDHRQIKFILKEYPVGSDVNLTYDGKWSICSRQSTPEYDMGKWLHSTF